MRPRTVSELEAAHGVVQSYRQVLWPAGHQAAS